jgi:lysyl-tRNA synthetase class 2
VSDGFSASPSDWLDLLFSHCIQPELGHAQPLIVTHYPVAQAALARRADDPRWAERFELFVVGVELANGYVELTDPHEFWERSEAQAALKAQGGKAVPPLPRRLQAAQQAGLPPCSGCALGFDRLLMVLTSSTRIDQVLAFPAERT